MKKILGFGPLFVIVAALLWSFDGVIRRSLYTLPPAVVVFYEHILGIVILLFLSSKWIPELRKLSKKEWIIMALVALFSSAIATIFYTAALSKVNYIQFSVVVLLQQLQPIWAIAAAALILKEKITKNFIFWAVLALIAAYLITFKELTINLSTGSGTAIAGLLAVSAGFFWGSSTAASKYVLNKVSFITTTALRFILAPIFIILFITSSNQIPSLFSLNYSQWGSLILITLSTGLVAQLIYYYGLKKTPARVTTICELVWPASAIFIDYFYFNKTFSVTQILGIIILILAIYKVTKYRK